MKKNSFFFIFGVLVLSSMIFIGVELQKARHLLKNNFSNLKDFVTTSIVGGGNNIEFKTDNLNIFNDALSREFISFKIHGQEVPINLSYNYTVFNLDSLSLNPKIIFSGSSDFIVKIDDHIVESGDILHIDRLGFDRKLKLEIELVKYNIKRIYFINTLNDNFPTYKIAGISKQDGFIYGNVFGNDKYASNFIFKLSKTGEVVYYNTQKDANLLDFHPTMIDGALYYQYINNIYVGNNIYSNLVLLDKDYNEVSSFNVSNNFIIDNHEGIFIDKDHIIYATYHPDYIDNKMINIIRIMEYKNGVTKEIFNSAEFNEFIEMSTEKNNIKISNYPNDYLHLNSMQLVGNDSILISMPAANAIIKYNYKIKKIEWVLGGTHDQFGITQEQQFYFQHDARLMNSELTLFDNHIKYRYNVKDDGYARGLVFKIDEKNKKIIDFKEIKHELHRNVNFCGNFQKNIFKNEVFYNIGWGCLTPISNRDSSYYTEFDSNGNINFEIFFENKNFGSYRMVRYLD